MRFGFKGTALLDQTKEAIWLNSLFPAKVILVPVEAHKQVNSHAYAPFGFASRIW